MLQHLSIDNYLLIDRLEIDWDRGLNIITGETGAGKSILLGALGLLLGSKNEGAAIKDTSRNCIIEGWKSSSPIPISTSNRPAPYAASSRLLARAAPSWAMCPCSSPPSGR